jgi:hypothetical protein
MEMGDGSPESMAPFVEQFGAALETYMKGQGIDIAGSDFVKAMTPKSTTPTPNPDGTMPAPTPKQAFDSFDKILDDTAGFASTEQGEALRTSMKTAGTALAAAPLGQSTSLNTYLSGTFGGRDYDAAAARLRTMGIPEATIQANVKRTAGNDFWGNATDIAYTGKPEFAAYAMYVKMLGSGLNQAGATSALISLLGEEKAYTALALERK